MIMARPWFLDVVRENDPEFVPVLETHIDFVMCDGAIPVKYKLLMTMVVDALLAHDSGVAAIAGRARDAGAGEDEIKEAVRVAYLYGGTPALVSALNAFPKDPRPTSPDKPK
jgi:alkylhydroperoxidase/carboxymuconolactone decarboxylase family protein YurZ